MESGRIDDTPDVRLRAGLRSVIDTFRPDVRLTVQQNLLLSSVGEEDRRTIDRILAEHRFRPAATLAPVIRDALACVALPTCGLALTDAERALPSVIRDVTAVLERVGLAGEQLGTRMTGCPNGCARPYSTEIGLVGRRKDRYDIHLGGAAAGTRLNELFAESVPAVRIADVLEPLLAAFAGERALGETFGDYAHRIGVQALRARFAASVGAA